MRANAPEELVALKSRTKTRDPETHNQYFKPITRQTWENDKNGRLYVHANQIKKQSFELDYYRIPFVYLCICTLKSR